MTPLEDTLAKARAAIGNGDMALALYDSAIPAHLHNPALRVARIQHLIAFDKWEDAVADATP